MGDMQAVCAGRHHERGKGHPRQALAEATQRGETAGASVQFPASPSVMAPAPVSAATLRASVHQPGIGGGSGAHQLRERARPGFSGCDAQIKGPS